MTYSNLQSPFTACGTMCDSRNQNDRQHHAGDFSPAVYVCRNWCPIVQGKGPEPWQPFCLTVHLLIGKLWQK